MKRLIRKKLKTFLKVSYLKLSRTEILNLSRIKRNFSMIKRCRHHLIQPRTITQNTQIMNIRKKKSIKNMVQGQFTTNLKERTSLDQKNDSIINFHMMDAQFYFLLRLGIIVTTVSLYNCLNCIQFLSFFSKTKGLNHSLEKNFQRTLEDTRGWRNVPLSFQRTLEDS